MEPIQPNFNPLQQNTTPTPPAPQTIPPQQPIQTQPIPQTTVPTEPPSNAILSQTIPQPTSKLIPSFNIPIQPTPSTGNGLKKVLFSIIFIIILLLLGGGVAYSYFEKIGPFKIASYTEENFFSSISQKIAEIKSASYDVSSSLKVVLRENGAEPFTVKITDDEELKKKYFYDSERLKNAVAIIGQLNNLSGYYSSRYYPDEKVSKPYPTNIKNIFTSGTNYYGSSSIKDPFTNMEYEYQVTDGGNNFLLTVNMDTDFAINAIKKYQYVSTTTIISGKKVSFTKDSSMYSYMSSEPPKPLLVQLGEYMKSLPADVYVRFSFGAGSEIKSNDVVDWTANFDATGDFGDLSYKINAEALKISSDYYFRINNIPSMFLFGDLGSVKGKWIKISSEVATSSSKDSYSTISYLKTSIPEAEESYRKNREKSAKFLTKVVEIADSEKLVTFRKNPTNEEIDGRKLIRYELSLRKEAIVSFYKKIQAEINNNPDFADYKYVTDQGLVEYLQSAEFDEVFDYFDKNNKVVFWTDTSGFPAIIENSMRIVPPDTATQLDGKQVNLVFKLMINDINKSLNIEAPGESTPIDQIINAFDENMDSGRIKGRTAALKANLSNLRASAELYYDKNGGYGKKAFGLGSCKKTTDTLFADEYISKGIEAATENNMSLATCASESVGGKVTIYAVSAPLIEDPDFSWCVDSSGSSKQIIGKIKKASCNN